MSSRSLVSAGHERAQALLLSPRLQLVTLTFSLSAILISVSGFSAPPPMHPWFTEHFTVGSTALPNGVNVEVTSGTPSGYSDYLVIINTSETYLYLSAIERPYAWPTEVPYVPPVELHSGRIAAFRVASGKAEIRDIVSREPPWQVGWKPVDEYRPTDPLRLSISGNRLTGRAHGIFTYYLAEYEWRNKYDYGGERPPNVQIPSPHEITLPMDYGAEEIILPLTISYTLNEHYPPRGDYAPEWVSMAVVLLATLCPFIVAGTLIVGLIWLGFKLFMGVRTRASSDQ